MSVPIPDKQAVVEALARALQEELAAVERVAAMARDEASSGETRSEGKYDTRATEASYLARGQAWRVVELRRLAAWFARLDPTRQCTQAEAGALVLLGGHRRTLALIAPVGGPTAAVEGWRVGTLSLRSPLGQALEDLEADDAFEVDTPAGLVEYEILAVC